jgi:hypothetical protein
VTTDIIETFKKNPEDQIQQDKTYLLGIQDRNNNTENTKCSCWFSVFCIIRPSPIIFYQQEHLVFSVLFGLPSISFYQQQHLVFSVLFDLVLVDKMK